MKCPLFIIKISSIKIQNTSNPSLFLLDILKKLVQIYIQDNKIEKKYIKTCTVYYRKDGFGTEC